MSHIPSFDEVSNLVDLTTEMENCQRTGCMCAFSRLEDFDNYFMEIMEIFDGSRPSTPDSIRGESDNDDCGRLSQSVTISNSFTDKGFMTNFKQQVYTHPLFKKRKFKNSKIQNVNFKLIQLWIVWMSWWIFNGYRSWAAVNE